MSSLYQDSCYFSSSYTTTIGRSVRSTTASVIQIPTTRTPIIPKKITKPRKLVWYNLDSRYGTSRRPALFDAVLVSIISITQVVQMYTLYTFTPTNWRS